MFRKLYIILLQIRSLVILYRNRHKRIFLIDVDNTLVVYEVGILKVGSSLNLLEGKLNKELIEWLERESRIDASTVLFMATARGFGSYRELRILNKELRFKGMLMFGSTESKVFLLNLCSSKIKSLVLVDDLCDYSKTERRFIPTKLDLSESINYVHPNEIY